MPRTYAQISPALLKWARKRADLSIPTLSKKLGLKEEKLLACEKGEAKLTFKQAQKLSQKTYIPFGILFSEDIPKVELPIPDFRTITSLRKREPSQDLLDVIYDAQQKQDWYKQYLKDNENQPIQFINSIKLDDNIKIVSKKISDLIYDRRKTALNFYNWESRLKYLIERIEDLGVIVIRNGIVRNYSHRSLDVEEFRGFALSDDYAPLIFINGKDSKSAQMFTLIHEFTHLLLGKTGISAIELINSEIDYNVERFCNKVAAEFLAPGDIYKREWNSSISIQDNIYNLAKTFKTSNLVSILRAFELNIINDEQRSKLWEMEWENIRQREKRTSSGGNPFLNLRYRNSQYFSLAVISSAHRGTVLYRDAFQLLGVKNFDSLKKYENSLLGIQ